MKVPTKPPLGGLNTKTPPVMLRREESPDLLNVNVQDDCIQKRGGFVPLVRDRMFGDAVQNVAYHATARTTRETSSTDGEFIVSPGSLIAGHRSAYDSEPALTIALWFRPDNLSGQHGGNSSVNADAASTYRPAPYVVRVRPIISKGPVKKSDTASGVTAANEWGTHTNAGMPFCIYMFNTGTGAAPVWEWRLSAHVLVAGAWTLQTVSVTEVPVDTRGRYHIIASVSNARIALRVGRLIAEETAIGYWEHETTFTGQLASNKCPIQVFDCPQLFPQRTVTGSATQRPGLGYTTAASGGYWFASVRTEGVVDDVSIWLGDRTLSTMDRQDKVHWTGQTDLLNLWTGGGTSIDYVKEETGRGNHLFFSPRGPTTVVDDGGKEGGTWFFDGQASWALVDTNSPNWRVYDYQSSNPASGTSTGTGPTSLTDGGAAWGVNAFQTTHSPTPIDYWVVDVDLGGGFSTRGVITANTNNVLTIASWTNGTPPAVSAYAIRQVSWRPSAMYSLVRDNMAHGLAVEFWPDSLEPAYLQVVAEIHGVMKLAINAAGNIVGYCRSGSVSTQATTSTQIGETYQGPVTSTTVIAPGRRYHVALLRRDGGLFLDLYVNGVLEASLATVANNYDTVATTGNSHVPGGFTFGIGSLQPLIRGILPFDPSIASSNEVANDVTSGFCGRIETVRIICSPTSPLLIQKHGPESKESWRFAETPTWKSPFDPGALRYLIQPQDIYNTVRNVGRGVVMQMGSQRLSGVQLGLTLKDATGPTFYQFGNANGMEVQPVVSNNSTDVLGHTTVSSTGARNYFVLAYWKLDRDDLDESYGGAHALGFERRYDTGSGGPLIASQQAHPRRSTHVQYSQVEDQCGMLGVLARCCGEIDHFDDGQAAVFGTNGFFTFRQRPYLAKAPIDIGPRWVPGMVRPVFSTTPVTFLRDFDVQTAGRRLSIAAAGRSLYWMKPPWDGTELFFPGGDRSYLQALLDTGQDFSVTGSGTKTVVQMTCWVKPLNLSGYRIIAAKRSTGGPRLINWMVYTDNGSLTIAGTEGTDFVWRFCEGQISGGPADVSRTTSLKVGVWNHVAVVVGPTTVTAWINGQAVPLVNTNSLTGANQTDPWGSDTSTAITGIFHIGGSPDGYAKIEMPLNAPNLVFQAESWYGYIADMQVRTSVDSTRYSGPRAFPPPMFTVDPSALYRWPMNEGRGYIADNPVTATAGWDAEIRFQEFLPIASGIRQGDRVYNSVSFRDRLVVTNGADRPRSLRFDGFSVAIPWVVSRLGMASPVAVDVQFARSTTPGSAIPVGLYSVSMAFLNDEGLESEASDLGAYQLPVAVGTFTLTVNHLPRSFDPQVVARRIYVSATGGGTPVFNRDLNDNESSDVTLEIGLTGGESPDPGNRLHAPRARHIAVAGSSLVLADLPDVSAGQNAFAFSTTNEITQFTVASIENLVDSEDGRPIIGIGHNMGQVFFSKRDSIHALSVGAIVSAVAVDAAVRLVQPSDGIGAGKASASNLLYGAGDRGAFLFDNTQVKYLTEKIEPTWRTFDLSTNGLVAYQGAFWRRYSQYWLSVRRAGETANTTILVFDLGTIGWYRQEAPQHRIMTIMERQAGEQVVAIGTTDGRVLCHDPATIVDYADNEKVGDGACTLLGSSGLSGNSTSLTMSGAKFQTIGAGLQGATVQVTHDGITESRRITLNDGDTIFWETPLTGWTAHTSFLIGAISAYWTTPWVAVGEIGSGQRLGVLGMELLPRAGNLTVDIASVTRDNAPDATWPTAADRSESFQVPMLQGFAQRALRPRVHNQGNYHRVRFGTYGINDPFGLVGYAPEIESSDSHDKTGR